MTQFPISGLAEQQVENWVTTWRLCSHPRRGSTTQSPNLFGLAEWSCVLSSILFPSWQLSRVIVMGVNWA